MKKLMILFSLLVIGCEDNQEMIRNRKFKEGDFIVHSLSGKQGQVIYYISYDRVFCRVADINGIVTCDFKEFEIEKDKSR